MIAIETSSGELIKIIKHLDTLNLGVHELFGFIGEDQASERLSNRKRKGFEFDRNNWLCKFKLEAKNGKIHFLDFQNCDITLVDNNLWSLSTKSGEYILRDTSRANFSDSLMVSQDEASWINGATEKILLLLCLLIPVFYFFQTNSKVELKEEAKIVDPITVKLIEHKQTVNISQKTADIKITPLTESQKSKRAVQRNLGFLGLVGSKDLTKVIGGVPQKFEKVTAGAGAGGDAGSGGEVLTGLGKGLKKTTVGNTGVAGLGGIGTKGAGGGAGGYGNTMVAAGEGVGLSAISVGSNDMVLEGGLSRYAVNATIAKYLSQVRRCYEKELNRSAGLEGLVTVAFQINARGKLNYSHIKNTTLKNKSVETCITQKMMDWKFPEPKGGVNVNINYPFMLRPVGT